MVDEQLRAEETHLLQVQLPETHDERDEEGTTRWLFDV